MVHYLKWFLLFQILCSQNQSIIHLKLKEEIRFSNDSNEYSFPLSGGYQSLNMQVLDWDQNKKSEIFVLNNGFQKTLVFEQLDSNSLSFKKSALSLNGLKLSRWFHFMDYDGDNDWDVLTLDPEFDVLGVQINEGTNVFPFFSSFQRIKDSLGNFIIPETGNLPVVYDINRDGKQDLFITTQGAGHIEYYKNIGSDTATFKLITRQYAGVQVLAAAKNSREKHGRSSFAFVDFDRDGDEDILWGDQFQRFFYYLENKGTWDKPNYIFKDSSFPVGTGVVSNKNYNLPIISDLNKDGFQDFFMLPQTDNFNAFHFYTGSSEFGKFKRISKSFISTIDHGLLSNISFFDLDKDSKNDIIISTYRNQDNYFDLYFYQNKSTDTKFLFKEFNYSGSISLPWKTDNKASYDFQIIDINSDGIWDIVFIDENGTLWQSINEGSSQAPLFNFYSKIKENLGNQAQFLIRDMDADGDNDLMVSNIAGQFKVFSSQSSLFDSGIDIDTVSKLIKNPLSMDYYANDEYYILDRKRNEIYKLKLNKFNFVSLNKISYSSEAGIGSSATITSIKTGLGSKENIAFGNFNGGLQIYSVDTEAQEDIKLSYNLLHSSENSLSGLVSLYIKPDRQVPQNPRIKDLNDKDNNYRVSTLFNGNEGVYRAEITNKTFGQQKYEIVILLNNNRVFKDTLKYAWLKAKGTMLINSDLSLIHKSNSHRNFLLHNDDYSNIKVNDIITVRPSNNSDQSILELNNKQYKIEHYVDEKKNWFDSGSSLIVKGQTKIKIVKSGSSRNEIGKNLLYQNVPNPFNLHTKLSFNLDKRREVKLEIYNLLGQKLRTIFSGVLGAGLKEFIWDGKNDYGKLSSSGIYFYVLKGENLLLSKKLILIK